MTRSVVGGWEALPLETLTVMLELMMAPLESQALAVILWEPVDAGMLVSSAPDDEYTEVPSR
jgi:hypothetical protein